MSRRGPQSDTTNCKVVLTSIAEDADKYLVCKTLATELGIPFEEASSLVKSMPVELMPSVPEKAAEIFAEKIRVVGGIVEVLSLSEGIGKFCDFHPHRRARAKCKSCNKYICEIDILASHKKLLCKKCYDRLRIRKAVLAAIAVLAVAGILVAWSLIRAPLQRYLRMAASDKHVEACLVLMADMVDSQMLSIYNDMVEKNRSYPGRRFEDIKRVFDREFREITGQNTDFMNMEVFGIYETDPDIPMPGKAGMWNFREFFRHMGVKHRLPKKDFDLQLFVYLVRTDQLPSGDAPWNLNIHRGNRAIVYFAVDSRQMRDHYLEAVMFAIGQMMGATPNIDDQGRPLFPEGYADPFKEDSYRQSGAELMAGYVPLGKGGLIGQVQNIANVKVGYKTAWEFGWISGSFYREAYRGLK